MYREHTFSKTTLVSLWIVHLTAIIIFIAVLAVDMMEYAGDHNGTNNGTLTAFMLLFVVMLVMTPLEMVFHTVCFLEPWTYLSFQIYRVLFSLIFIVVQIVTYVNVDKALYAAWIRILNIVLIAVTVLVLLSAAASLWYGTVVLRRHRRRPRTDFVAEKDDRDTEEPRVSPASSLMASGGKA